MDLIAEMAPVFEMATTGFVEFQKSALPNASSGDYSQSASSGDYSQSASSGDYSQSASSGYYSQSASSGNSSQSASSGDYSQSASSGNSSQSASSGYYSKSASSGNSSQSASSGNSSQSASSGNSSQSASSGNYSKSASSGNSSQSASSGNSSQSASSGNYSKSASSGYSSKSASSGDYSACSALGYRAAVRGDIGNLIMASEYVKRDSRVVPVGGKADLIDGKKLKAQQWYIVEGGNWVAVDFTDGVFSYLISSRNGVKKVRTEDGNVLFVVSDGNGNSAHGATIAEARKDLVYKVIAKFDGELPSSASGQEWVGIYRAVTGACAAGVRQFVESSGADLGKSYTAAEIAAMVRGQYGAEAFAKKLTGAA